MKLLSAPELQAQERRTAGLQAQVKGARRAVGQRELEDKAAVVFFAAGKGQAVAAAALDEAAADGVRLVQAQVVQEGRFDFQPPGACAGRLYGKAKPVDMARVAGAEHGVESLEVRLRLWRADAGNGFRAIRIDQHGQIPHIERLAAHCQGQVKSEQQQDAENVSKTRSHI